MTRRLATSPLAKCQPGDLLWVREAFATHRRAENRIHTKGDGHPWGSPIYRATFSGGLAPECEGFTKWRPSIHMPRWASRITLTVTGTKIERLQDISEEDALAEGISWSDEYEGYHTEDCRCYHASDPAKSFEKLWDSIHGLGVWEANPHVVVISFAVERRNIDQPPHEARGQGRVSEPRNIRPLGQHQRDLLARLGGVTMALVVGDKVSDSLVKRGLAVAEPDGSFVRIAPAGLRMLADEIEAGRIEPFSVEGWKERADA